MSMGVMEYDSEENDSYNNNGGVVEEQVDWHMDNQSNEKYMCMQQQPQMNRHLPPHPHQHGRHQMSSQFQPQFFHHSNSQMHSFGHHQHPSLPPQQQQQQMNANYMVEQVSEPVRCEVVATSNENSSPDRCNKVGGSGSNNALHSTSKTPNHQFVMGTVKRRGRPPKPDSEKKARKEPKPRGRPPRNSLLQVAIVSKKPSSSSLFPTVNSQQGSDNASLQESPFPLLPSAFNNINNSDSGKKSRGRPRIHPQKDPGLKRPRGRPRVTPLVGEAAWKAECGKMRRLVKKKDQVITILKNKLIELGHNIEEVLMQGRDDVTGGEDDNDEDDENNDDDNQQSQTQHNSSSNNNSIIEGATVDDSHQKYLGMFADMDGVRNVNNDGSNNNNMNSSRNMGNDNDDDEDDDEDGDEEEDEEEEEDRQMMRRVDNVPGNHHHHHSQQHQQQQHHHHHHQQQTQHLQHHHHHQQHHPLDHHHLHHQQQINEDDDDDDDEDSRSFED